jgi:hypothetical protein
MKKGTPEWRISVLQLAMELKNVRRACTRKGMDRTTFYKLRKRCAQLPPEKWLAAVKDRSRRWKSHAQQTRPETRKRIFEMSLQHPSWGCNRLAARLASRGIQRSANTIQKILNANKIGTREERWRQLDTLIQSRKHTDEQFEFIKQFNPNSRDRDARKLTPGALLYADRFKIGPFPKLGAFNVYAVVDSYSSFAFASIRKARDSKSAVWLLEKRVIPYLRSGTGPKKRFSISSGRNFELPNCEVYREWLKQHEIHRRQRETEPPGNFVGSGSLERFKRAVATDFMTGEGAEQVFDDLKLLRIAFKAWLADYNKSRLVGFPNFGRSPNVMMARAGLGDGA